MPTLKKKQFNLTFPLKLTGQTKFFFLKRQREVVFDVIVHEVRIFVRCQILLHMLQLHSVVIEVNFEDRTNVRCLVLIRKRKFWCN